MIKLTVYSTHPIFRQEFKNKFPKAQITGETASQFDATLDQSDYYLAVGFIMNAEVQYSLYPGGIFKSQDPIQRRIQEIKRNDVS